MKILMATMSMGLGGAETHVLELSRALAARGHEVFVASAGGVYAEELERAGVKHVQAPLCSKSPAAVARAVRVLSRLMEQEKFDIVHAHARIPAFICGKLKKKYGFAFITTAHFDFRVDALLAGITDWGERVLAVSADIAENVTKKYGYPAEKITLVNNGIDTARFSPANSGAGVRARLGVDGKKVVMYLGRLDEDSFLPAKVLLESAEALYRECADVRVLIVGSGEKYGELCEKAKEINERLGAELALLPGGTAQAAEHIAACDVFVGPSRSAMEALASGKPTVVAGTFGMLGIFSPEVAGEALRTNFCCRASAPATAEKVSACVLRLLSLSAEEREAAALYGRNFIKEHYSVAAMADTCEAEYKNLLAARGKRAVLCGYYGYGNIGDEAMLGALTSALARSGRAGKICVMSRTPAETAARFCAEAVPRYDVRALHRAFAEADVLIFGGGNILQDKTSTKSLVYYTHVLSLAQKHACRTALCANGIGPILQKKNMKLVKNALAQADYISMRDEGSLLLARELTGREDIFAASDLAFACAQGGEKPAHLSHVPKNVRYYAVFPKRIRGVAPARLISFFCRMKREHGLVPVFAAMYKGEDGSLCHELSRALPWAYYAVARDAADVLALIGGAEFSLCMRLHAAVFSVMQGRAAIAVSDDSKLASFFGGGMAGCALFGADFDADGLFAAAESALQNREEICRSLKKEAARRREEAEAELERLIAHFFS
ncbi:MAG: glycosyltransferase [Clostridia bacterium]|nr:glycosyltransferase [Clostridia bacterium]